jgi:hypothetical protein
MPEKTIQNMGASVRARLLNISREKNQTFQLVLTHYVIERLLYRLSQTEHRDRFILKGAVLLSKWFDDPVRPTKDLDLLAVGDDDPEEMVKTFQDICAVPFDDGVSFDTDAVEVDRIREELEYGGMRIRTNATVDKARVRVVIDIAFGDSVEPGLQEMDLPVLLDFPAPHLRAYARETVIAIAATFARRKTTIPSEAPDALTSAFAEDPAKIRQWNSFVADAAYHPGTLPEVVKDLAVFLMPHAEAAAKLTIPRAGLASRPGGDDPSR